MNNNYNINLKQFAREHRNDSTKAEIRLWCELLRNKQMMGYPFLRQRPIGDYIVDFFSKPLNLVIETDGLSHFDAEVVEKDELKEKEIKKLGYSILRFDDDEIMNDLENVRREIEGWIEQNHPPAPFKGGRTKRLKKRTDA